MKRVCLLLENFVNKYIFLKKSSRLVDRPDPGTSINFDTSLTIVSRCVILSCNQGHSPARPESPSKLQHTLENADSLR